MELTRDNIHNVIFYTNGIYYYIDYKNKKLYNNLNNDFSVLDENNMFSFRNDSLDGYIENINKKIYKFIGFFNEEKTYELW